MALKGEGKPRGEGPAGSGRRTEEGSGPSSRGSRGEEERFGPGRVAGGRGGKARGVLPAVGKGGELGGEEQAGNAHRGTHSRTTPYLRRMSSWVMVSGTPRGLRTRRPRRMAIS